MKEPIRALTFITALMLLLPPVPGLAALPVASDPNAPSLPDRAAVIEAARSIDRERYPDADVVEVERRTWVQYRPDGTYTERYEAYSKVLTEKGKRRLKTITSSFTIPYNTTAFETVEVIQEDGTVLPVNVSKNSRVMIQHGQMSHNIYNPNDRMLRVSIPKLEIGDMVHYVMVDEFEKVRTPETWSDYVPLEGTDPIRRAQFTVVAPDKLPLRCRVIKDQIPGTVTEFRDRQKTVTRHTWVAVDVPQAFPEPDMPPLYSQVQRLLLSTIPDWEWVSRWYWHLCAPQLAETTSEMRETVQRVTRGIKVPRDRIEAIFYWVSQKIRYLGLTLETEAPGYEPHPVRMTFERRAGVCRDKAALLVALLRMAGFEAYPVLIMNGPKKDPEVPQPWFNHAVAAVRRSDGTFLLMDPTDENTRELFPAYLNNQSYLVATPEGEPLHTSPTEPAADNMMRVETQAALDGNGRFSAETRLRFQGINDNAYRGYFAGCTPKERRRFFERLVTQVFPGAELKGYSIFPENVLDTSMPLEATLAFQTGDIRIQGSGTSLLPLPHVGRRVGMVHHLIRKTGLKKRRYPLETHFACGVEEILTVNLTGSGLGPLVSPPEFSALKTPGVTCSANLDVQKGELVSRRRFVLHLPEYDPGQYRTLKRAITVKERNEQIMPIFSQRSAQESRETDSAWYTPFAPEAVVLEERVEIRLHSQHDWDETLHRKIRILTYNGKKRNSDIHIAYQPAWEEVEILKASVTAPSGKTTVIAQEEINRMDAPWVGGAPRYPEGKTLVVSLPGVVEGGTVTYTIQRQRRNQPFFSINPGGFLEDGSSRSPRGIPVEGAAGVFRYHDPLVQKTLTIHAPKELDLRILKADQGIGLETSWPRPRTVPIHQEFREVNGEQVLRFAADHVPPVERLDHLPPWYAFNPVVFLSGGEWTSAAARIHDRLVAAAAGQEKTREKALALTADVSDHTQRILRIRDFAARHIRPVGIPFCDMPLSALTPADRTLADGYGSLTDRAVLLYAMLSALDYAPEFVLVSRASPIPSLQGPFRDSPSLAWFDTLLVRVKTAEGMVYLNDTDQYAMLGTTRHRGHPALALPGAEIFPIQPARENLQTRESVCYRIRLQENGDAWIQKRRRLWGTEFAVFRKRFSEMNPEDRKQHHQELVSDIRQGATAAGPLFTNYRTYPGVESFAVTVPDFAVRQGPFLYLSLPGLAEGISGVDAPRRELPLYRGQYNQRDVRVEVETSAPLVRAEALPPETLLMDLWDSGQLRMDTRYRPTATPKGTPRCAVRIHQEIDVDPMLIPPPLYGQLVHFDRILGRPGTRTVSLLLAEGEEDREPALAR